MTREKTASIILERIEKAIRENNRMIVATRKMYDEETSNTQEKEYLAGILDTLACTNDRLQAWRKGFVA